MSDGTGLPTVVLISGSGTNLQSFIDGQAAGRLPIDLRAVVSSRADAFGLTRARRAGIPTAVLPPGTTPLGRPTTGRWRNCWPATARRWWCWQGSCASSPGSSSPATRGGW